MQNKYKIVAISAGLIILAIAFFLIYKDSDRSWLGGELASSTDLSSTQPAEKAPDYNRSFVYPAYFTAEARAITDKKFTEIRLALKTNPADISAWVDLGNQYNLVKDFEGASLAWQYAVALNSSNFVPLYNLGALYMSDIRDYVLSEKYLKLAVLADPSQPTIYEMLYRLYRYGLKDDVRAKAILKQGVSAVNDKVALQTILDHYDEQ